MKLKELRKKLNLTQPQASQIVGIPFRTYCRYEDDDKYEGTFKYEQIVSILNETANKIVLKIENIKDIVSNILSNYDVDSCYLFGSYAKGKATCKSDVDLMIVSSIEGMEFYQLIDELEQKLSKKVDLIRLDVAIQNLNLISEILKDGIKIYGQHQK